MCSKVHYSNRAFFSEGKVILVTGASSGIGRAVCLSLAKYHPKLVIFARRRSQLLKTAKLLEQLKIEVLPIVGDIRNREDREKLVDFAIKRFGRIDVLINNAGLGKANLFLEQPETEIDQLIETNLLALIKMTKQVLPIMKRQESGMVINMSSSLALLPVYPFAVYCATKSAVKIFSDSIRQEFKKYGISVSTVMPGPYDTNFNKVAGLDTSKVPAYQVDKLANSIAKLIIRPKKDLICPKSYSVLVWFTERFKTIKNFLTFQIAQMIDKGRLNKLIEEKAEETKIKLVVNKKK